MLLATSGATAETMTNSTPADALVGQLASAECVARGEAEEHLGRRDAARAFYERALTRLAGPDDGKRASTIIRWIARTYHVDANHTAALECLEAASAIARAWEDDVALGNAINIEATIHTQQGDLDEAERLYLAARALAVGAPDPKLAAMIAQNLGMLADIRGDFAQALRHYEAALTEYRVLGMTAFVCAGLNNLGLLFAHREEWGAAEAAFVEALDINAFMGDVHERIGLLTNVAEMWISRREFERGRASVDAAHALAGSTADHSADGQIHKLLGVIARESGASQQADEHFRTADQIALARCDLLLQAEIARELAESARQQGRNRELFQELNRAHRLFNQLRARRDLADLDRRSARLESEFLDVARKWGESIEEKDRYTQGHCVRVADLACEIASEAKLDRQALFWFRIGALLHDVGKILIPEAILNKTERLTPEEWNLMRNHTTAGIEILAEVEFPWDVRPIVESHHERWDGTGYPHGLAGEAIPLVARILGVADVYDALTSVRSYKGALSHDEAVEMMRKDVGTAFDPAVFALFELVSERRTASGSAVPDQGAAGVAASRHADTHPSRSAP